MNFLEALHRLKDGKKTRLTGTCFVLDPENGVSDETLVEATIGDLLSEDWQKFGEDA